MNESRKLLAAVSAGATLLVTLSFAHPFGNPRAAEAASGHLLAGAQIPAPIIELVERKCGNCHSESVAWPVYARIAPVSWLVERDVMDARAHMNLSHWDSYSTQEQGDLLGRLGAEARSGQMPPARYTAMHHDSKLRPEEREALYRWARAERKRLTKLGQNTN